MTLNAFAADLEAAVPRPAGRHRQGAVGRAHHQRQADPTDVWAVSFIDGAGIGKVALAPPSTVPGVEGLQPQLRPAAAVECAGIALRV
ncbi:hypothetical protein CSW58_12985 [Caulobacter sp. B11]|uniref:hypothetical protein n=1 Tax=Caulobacter sp. B11 TaxID=2048899 RepID=UPI000C12B147|nr:hypothetical protein [Caulobacter sp. B11]PHY12388.1 hypothetical protein CSW58_12985 [Caulobacter sp. B11]